jgi:hypothetical protein
MGEGNVHSEFSRGNLREKDHIEESDVDWNIVFKLIFKMWDRSMDWIYLPQDRDRWRALVKAVLQLCVT